MDDKVKLKRKDFCVTHQKYCNRLPHAQADDVLTIAVGGTPCPDWSSFGKHGKEGGSSAPVFATQLLVRIQNSLPLFERLEIVYYLLCKFSRLMSLTLSDVHIFFRIKAVKQSQPKVFIHENVTTFPKATLARMLGHSLTKCF